MKRAITSAFITFVIVMAAGLIAYKAGAIGPEAGSSADAAKRYSEYKYADSRIQEVQPSAAGQVDSAQQPGPGYGQGYCRNRGGGCCNRGDGAQGAASDPAVIEGVRKAAADYYSGKYNDKDFTVEVKDFGCHQEAYIIKGGEQIKRLTVSNGSVNEI